MCAGYAKASRLLQPMAAVMGKSHTTPLMLTANLAASKQVASNGMRQQPATSSVSMAIGGGDVQATHEAAIADIEAAHQHHQHVAPDDERWHPAAANVSSHPVTRVGAWLARVFTPRKWSNGPALHDAADADGPVERRDAASDGE